jgi:hypothetical protein
VSTPADDDRPFPLAEGSPPAPGGPGPRQAQTNGAGTGVPTRPVALGRLNLLLALLGLLCYIAADLVGLLPLAFAALPLGLLLVLAPVRWRRARRGQLEFGPLRQPLRRELRPYLLQAGNHWLFWGLFGAVAIATPPSASSPARPGCGSPREGTAPLPCCWWSSLLRWRLWRCCPGGGSPWLPTSW